MSNVLHLLDHVIAVVLLVIALGIFWSGFHQLFNLNEMVKQNLYEQHVVSIEYDWEAS